MNKVFKPSDYFIIAAALISMAISIALWFTGSRDEGLYVGIWVPSILALGIYFKLAVYNANKNLK